MNKTLSTKQMLALLHKEIKAHGGISGAAKAWGVSEQVVRNSVNTNRLPSPAVLDALGIEADKRILYRYIVKG